MISKLPSQTSETQQYSSSYTSCVTLQVITVKTLGLVTTLLLYQTLAKWIF